MATGIDLGLGHGGKPSRLEEKIERNAQEKIRNDRIKQLVALMFYHERERLSAQRELETLLADDISSIPY